MVLSSNIKDRLISQESSQIELLGHPCFFLDFQTTGASPKRGSLLEVAWCRGDGRGRYDTDVSSFLVEQPEDEEIPFRIQALTGISADDMQDAVSKRFLLEHLQAAMKDLPDPKLCVIHYARFEAPFILDLIQENGDGNWPFLNICTFEIARRLYPNLPSRGIRALGGFLGIDMEEVKRASSHVGATRVIWRHLVERLQAAGINDVATLQDFLSTKAISKRNKLEYPIERIKRLELPNCPGVYRMLSQSGRVLYVGKATSLKSRVNSHFRGRKRKTTRSMELLTQVCEIQVTECGSPLEAALLETDEIKRLDPPYNTSLKQRSRGLLFSSRDFTSFSEAQDEGHPIGPFVNPRAMDALLRLCVTINSGIADPLALFEAVEIEDFIEGVDIFVDRHGIVREDGMSMRSLVALGLKLFRNTRQMLRQLAAEKLLAAAIDKGEDMEDVVARIEAVEGDDERAALVKGRLSELEETADGESELDEFEEDLELTPEEIANRLESTLIGVARAYLVSREITQLLNADVRYVHHKNVRVLRIREGEIFLDERLVSRLNQFITKTESKHSAMEASTAGNTVANGSDCETSCHWSGLDIRDYDRMRVLLTELTIMQSAQKQVTIDPPLVVLSRW